MIQSLMEIITSSYHAGNHNKMAAAASTLLAAIPGDRVAMQFLGLALHQMGRTDPAHRLFTLAATQPELPPQGYLSEIGEPASVTTYREATRPESGLHEAWRRIATISADLGLTEAAQYALKAAACAQGIHPATKVAMGNLA